MGFGFWGKWIKKDLRFSLTETVQWGSNKTTSYLNVPFDLSKVIFVATANRIQPIPPPLLDRMEVIELPGYTPEEKLKIAMKHLIPRVLDQHGLSSNNLEIPEGTVKLLIQRYTREAGVRNLERNLAALARAAVVRVAEQESTISVSKDVHPMDAPLLDTRLAKGAEVEMEVLPMGINNHEISNAFRSTSALVVDEAMLEKVLGVRARAADLQLAGAGQLNLMEGRDVHIHFPAGAVPKDGPSAGVTLVTSLVSLFSQRKVRADTAMTGEMTLRGLVLPVGGIKDKILAAHRYGIKRVILPERNVKDLVEVPSHVLASLEILLAKRMEDVLEEAFEGGCPWRLHAKL
ncbi:hypothetical protein IFM89_003339 [Coptis chinensis]|uniref:Lon proteolytic domain-containing protein n=1 Tax=Coptis chinensis TaxID=261450 RepID=A0A835IUB2_9MAGN|nr:hypothetical protein IFM89_003339 [Coptis chinensis]